MRANIIDLGVAVVTGSAFAAVVSTVVSSLIESLLAAIGGAESPGFGIQLVGSNPATFMDVGAIVNALIVFVITRPWSTSSSAHQ